MPDQMNVKDMKPEDVQNWLNLLIERGRDWEFANQFLVHVPNNTKVRVPNWNEGHDMSDVPGHDVVAKAARLDQHSYGYTRNNSYVCGMEVKTMVYWPKMKDTVSWPLYDLEVCQNGKWRPFEEYKEESA